MFPITTKMKYNFDVLFCNLFLFPIMNAVNRIIKMEYSLISTIKNSNIEGNNKEITNQEK